MKDLPADFLMTQYGRNMYMLTEPGIPFPRPHIIVVSKFYIQVCIVMEYNSSNPNKAVLNGSKTFSRTQVLVFAFL